MNNAPHSTLKTIMRAYTEIGEKPTDQVERVREVAMSILAQNDHEVPDLFFSKDREDDVSKGLDEFIMQVTENDQPPNGEIKAQAVILNQRVYQGLCLHHLLCLC